MSILTNQQIIFFVTILIGYLYGRKDSSSDVVSSRLNKALLNLFMPSVLFINTYKSDVLFFNIDFVIVYLFAFFVNSIITYIFFYKKHLSEFLIMTLAASYVNSAFFTFPVIYLMLKDVSGAILLNVIQLFFINIPVLLIIGAIRNKEKASILKIIFRSVTQPIILFPMFGVGLSFYNVLVPTLVSEGLSFFAQSASNLALLAFGLSIAKLNFLKIKFNKEIVLLIIQKSCFHPLIILLITNFIFIGLSDYWYKVLVISALSPTAVLVHIYAKQFEVMDDVVLKVVLSTSFISIPLLVLYNIIM